MKWVINKSVFVCAILVAIVALPVYRAWANREELASELLGAAETGDARQINSALAAGAQANHSDSYGMTPLMLAAGAGKVRAVELLLNRGAPIDASADVAGTALMRAASHGNTEVVRILLKHGAAVNKVNRYGESALVRAIECNDASVEIVQMLLDAGADPNVRCTDGETPLSLAMSNCNLVKAKCLIAHGARIEAVKVAHAD